MSVLLRPITIAILGLLASGLSSPALADASFEAHGTLDLFYAPGRPQPLQISISDELGTPMCQNTSTGSGTATCAPPDIDAQWFPQLENFFYEVNLGKVTGMTSPTPGKAFAYAKLEEPGLVVTIKNTGDRNVDFQLEGTFDVTLKTDVDEKGATAMAHYKITPQGFLDFLFADIPKSKTVRNGEDFVMSFPLNGTVTLAPNLSTSFSVSFAGVKGKAAPEPITFLASSLAVGFGFLFQKEYAKKRPSK